MPQPIRSTTHIWLVTRHQYGILRSFRGKPCNGGVTKCRLFSHASELVLLDDTALNFNMVITFHAAQHMEEKIDALIRLSF